MSSFFKKVLFFSKEKKFLFGIIFMFFLSIILTIVEILGIASITSLVAILSISDNFIFGNFFDGKINLDLNTILLIIFLIFVTKSIIQILYNYLQTKITELMIVKYSQDLFTNFINTPYELNLLKNPSELIRKISRDVEMSISYVFIIVSILKETLILIGIFFLLFWSKTNTVVLVFLIFGIISVVFYESVKKKLKDTAASYVKSQTRYVKLINQSFGSLKENIILNINQNLVKKFSKDINKVRNFEFFRTFIKGLPRVIFELIAVSSIVVIALLLSKNLDNLDHTLQVLALIAVCSVRLIPSFNVLTNAFSTIKSYQEIFNYFYKDILFFKKYIKKKNKPINKIKFRNSIELKDISFRYPLSKKFIIKNANLLIKKGKITGIFGKTGEGKTTLVDLIIGLLSKSSGEIYIDNKKNIDNKINFLENTIGYVPQTPYLIDDTIENNIVFGRKIENKKELISNALKFSQLDKFIKSLPNGLNTVVGHNGIRLSGGQRQRIVIARALLLRPTLLVFDEATSSLDSVTENQLIKEIYKLNKIATILIISHKLEIIKKCKIKYFVEKGKVVKKN